MNANPFEGYGLFTKPRTAVILLFWVASKQGALRGYTRAIEGLQGLPYDLAVQLLHGSFPQRGNPNVDQRIQKSLS